MLPLSSCRLPFCVGTSNHPIIVNVLCLRWGTMRLTILGIDLEGVVSYTTPSLYANMLTSNGQVLAVNMFNILVQ